MKVLVHDSNPTKEQSDCMCAMLHEHTVSGASILIGDYSQNDDHAQSFLADMGYPSVVLYSTAESPAPLYEGWTVRPVECVKHRRSLFRNNGFGHEREAIEAMAVDADCGLVLWDGHNLDAFAVILCLAILGKSVDVIRTDGRVEEVSSFDDLRALLPTRNPQHRSREASIPMRDQRMVAERFIPSKTFAKELAMTPFKKWGIVEIILGSPTSLEKKLEALDMLSNYDDVLHEIVDSAEMLLGCDKKFKPKDRVMMLGIEWRHIISSSFSPNRDAVQEALGALNSTGPGEIVYRKSLWDERPELFEVHEHGVAPFSGIEAALEDLRFEMARDEWDDDAPFWSTFEKWKLASNGAWEKLYTYYAIKDEVVFFDKNAYDEKEHYWTIEDSDYGGLVVPNLNIRVPFGVGDMITLDCRPFAPLRHALIIEAEREGWADCCMPRVLHLDDYESKREGKPMWTEASPKHGCSMNLCMPGYSPLYRMDLHEGPLPEEEQLLSEVRDWLYGDAEKGKQLGEALMHEMSTEEVLAFISGHGHE